MTLIRVTTDRWHVLGGQTGEQHAGGVRLLSVDSLLVVWFLNHVNKLTIKKLIQKWQKFKKCLTRGLHFWPQRLFHTALMLQTLKRFTPGPLLCAWWWPRPRSPVGAVSTSGTFRWKKLVQGRKLGVKDGLWGWGLKTRVLVLLFPLDIKLALWNGW